MARSPMSLQPSRKTPITVPLPSSQRPNTGAARAMNLQRSSRASVGSALATFSTIARRWESRSPARARAPRQSTKDSDRAMAATRLRISLANSPGLCAPANSSLRRRLAAALPVLISNSNSANLAGPSASKFFALSVVFVGTRSLLTYCSLAVGGGDLEYSSSGHCPPSPRRERLDENDEALFLGHAVELRWRCPERADLSGPARIWALVCDRGRRDGA